MAVILDSNIWIAFLYTKDPTHQRAGEIFEKIKEKIILPEYILLEVATVISQQVNKKLSDEFIKYVIDNKDIEILPSSNEFLEEFINFYLSRKEEGLSFVDYSLLYLSRKLKVLTFDKKLQKLLNKK